jgi:hypothetical protein
MHRPWVCMCASTSSGACRATAYVLRYLQSCQQPAAARSPHQECDREVLPREPWSLLVGVEPGDRWSPSLWAAIMLSMGSERRASREPCAAG